MSSKGSPRTVQRRITLNVQCYERILNVRKNSMEPFCSLKIVSIVCEHFLDAKSISKSSEYYSSKLHSKEFNLCFSIQLSVEIKIRASHLFRFLKEAREAMKVYLNDKYGSIRVLLIYPLWVKSILFYNSNGVPNSKSHCGLYREDILEGNSCDYSKNVWRDSCQGTSVRQR